jgi:lantibiotic modifying enzyme
MKKMISWIITALLTALSVSAGERNYFEGAQQTARWLQSCALQTQAGKVWPADPRDSATISTNLYSGSSGAVLFFLEMYRVTQYKMYLDEARAGADYLLATLPDTLSQEQSGLYTGVAGIGFVLAEAYKITHDEKYRNGALRCVELLHKHAKQAGTGIEWNNVTDIISGSAGSGLFLL